MADAVIEADKRMASSFSTLKKNLFWEVSTRWPLP